MATLKNQPNMVKDKIKVAIRFIPNAYKVRLEMAVFVKNLNKTSTTENNVPENLSLQPLSGQLRFLIFARLSYIRSSKIRSSAGLREYNSAFSKETSLFLTRFAKERFRVIIPSCKLVSITRSIW